MESKKNGSLAWLENTNDGVMAIDSEQRIVMWNKAAEAITGFSKGEVEGKKCYELFVGRDVNNNVMCRKDCWDTALAKRGEVIPSKEVLTRTARGLPVCLGMTNVTLPEAEEGAPVLVHIFRDATLKRDTDRVLGQMLSLVDDLTRLREQKNPTGEAQAAALPPLSRRELEILALLTEGASVKTIAESLFISPATARKHVQNILSKLKVHSQVQAVAYATRHNLVRKPA